MARYANHLRLWIPCVNATSLALFLDTILSSLAIKTNGDPLMAIMSELNTSLLPTVILFDNFETPWDTDDQSDVESVLREINNIANVTMFVTMRSSMPPCDDIPWHSVNLRAVDADAARSIYTSRHAHGAADPDLPHLLDMIGNMPLAIILMAKVGKMTRLSAVKLIEEYKRSGTSIMGRGSDAKSSMDLCIGLSVNSPRMKAHPEAFQLLCIISMLPTGASYEMLSKWWAKELAVLMGALEVLLETSLVEQSDLKYSVLPVIQSYIRHSSRFLDKTVRDMIDVACAFLNEHSSVVGDPLYKSNSATLRTEDSNLTHVLLHLTTPIPVVIRDGHLALARHQQHHRPRADIVEHAMMLTCDVNDKPLRSDVLFHYAKILFARRQFAHCVEPYKDALTIFISIYERKKAAECRLALDEALRYDSGGFETDFMFCTREKIINEAKADFEMIGEDIGIGRCLLALGQLHRQFRTDYSHYTTSLAFSYLMQASDLFARLNNESWRAECSQSLATSYYRAKQYELAEAHSMFAIEKLSNVGQSTKYARHLLADIKVAQGEYDRALVLYMECLEIDKSQELTLDGTVLEGSGLAFAGLQRIHDARKAFEQAIHQYPLTSGQWKNTHILRCHFFLRRLEHREETPSTEERFSIEVMYAMEVEELLAILWQPCWFFDLEACVSTNEEDSEMDEPVSLDEMDEEHGVSTDEEDSEMDERVSPGEMDEEHAILEPCHFIDLSARVSTDDEEDSEMDEPVSLDEMDEEHAILQPCRFIDLEARVSTDEDDSEMDEPGCVASTWSSDSLPTALGTNHSHTVESLQSKKLVYHAAGMIRSVPKPVVGSGYDGRLEFMC
ncbi:hypothetical protein H0H92_012194 [Tricholoma furcatifolium]|nr:hypothetical protein H0H92_012194 [Tricholoma furcatifolium]